MTEPNAGPLTAEVEELSAKFHEIYMAEARRQGDVRHKDAYADLAENVKEFDRVLARHVLSEFAQLRAECDRKLESIKTAARILSGESWGAAVGACAEDYPWLAEAFGEVGKRKDREADELVDLAIEIGMKHKEDLMIAAKEGRHWKVRPDAASVRAARENG